MADLFDAMKNIAKGTIESYGMCEPVIGLVMSTSPLEVRISDRIVLDANQLLITQAVVEKTINCSHMHECKESMSVGLPMPIVVRDGLKKGDEVLMLKAEKGQLFVILCKVVRG